MSLLLSDCCISAILVLQACVELLGTHATSGVLPLVRGSKTFAPGSEDSFTFPHIPWLGDLRCLRIATDGSGFFPAWHLR